MVTENHNTAENGSLGLSQISQGHWNVFKFVYCLFIGIRKQVQLLINVSECSTERVKSEPINEAKHSAGWIYVCAEHMILVKQKKFFFWQLPLGVASVQGYQGKAFNRQTGPPCPFHTLPL